MSAPPQFRQRSIRSIQAAPKITFDLDAYDRIAPGEYFAFCTHAVIYRDPGYRRWIVRLRWNVLPTHP